MPSFFRSFLKFSRWSLGREDTSVVQSRGFISLYILSCSLYTDPGAKFLAGILSGISLYSDAEKITLLLSRTDAL